MARDLSGVWTADDGGTYYLQQVDQTLWWLGQSDDGSLQRGLVFTNIFLGTVRSGDGNAGHLVAGPWADVPRGRTMNFGELSLSIEFDSDGNPVQLHRLAETGGFSGATWTFQADNPDSTFPAIRRLFGRIVKNTWHVDFDAEFDIGRETLADNLEVIKEPVTLFGTLQPGETFPVRPFGNSFPLFQRRTRHRFLDLNDRIATAIFNAKSIDADMTCHLTLDPDDLPPDLFIGMSEEHKREVQDKIGSIHPEIVMFAGEDDDDAEALLPGWGELGGDSVLLNGVPIDGICEIRRKESVSSIGRDALVPVVGQSVRVTGVMCFDIGHEDRPLEIHPVYALDLITATSCDDVSGAWGDSLGFTYDVHQIFSAFWIFITPPFRDLSFVAVFQGEIAIFEGDTAPDDVTVLGSWSTVPISRTVGFGEMRFQLDPVKCTMVVGDGSPLAGRVLRKLYDASGHPCPADGVVEVRVQGAGICEVKEIEGGSVIYRADDAALRNLPGVQYHWRTTGGQIAGSDSLRTVEVIALPTAGTPVTVSVDITTLIGCSSHGERTFITQSHVEAVRLQLWCELRLSVVALVNKYLAPFKVFPPPPRTQLEPPPGPTTLHELRQALARVEELLKTLQRQRID